MNRQREKRSAKPTVAPEPSNGQQNPMVEEAKKRTRGLDEDSVLAVRSTGQTVVLAIEDSDFDVRRAEQLVRDFCAG